MEQFTVSVYEFHLQAIFHFLFVTGSRFFANAHGMAHAPPSQTQHTNSCGFQSIAQHNSPPMPSLNGKARHII